MFYGAVGFAAPTDRGTELQSWLFPSELASPPFTLANPNRPHRRAPLATSPGACLSEQLVETSRHCTLPGQKKQLVSQLQHRTDVHHYILPRRQIFPPSRGLQNKRACRGGGVQVHH